MEGSFRIGDFAKNLGVSQDLLKHYESYGIIEPARRSKSGYRFYRFSQTPLLLFAKEYQNLGFSLKSIGNILEGLPPRALRELFEGQINTLERQQRETKARLSSLEDLVRVSRQIEDGSFDGRWSVETVPGFSFLAHSRGFDFPTEDAGTSLFAGLRQMGIVRQACRLDWSGEAPPVFGLAVADDDVSLLDVESPTFDIRVAPTRCLVYQASLVRAEDGAGDFEGRLLAGVRGVIDHHHFEVGGPLWATTLCQTGTDPQRHVHRRILVPLA